MEDLENEKVENEKEKNKALSAYDKKTKTTLRRVLGTFTSFMTTFALFDKFFINIVDCKGIIIKILHLDFLGDWFNAWAGGWLIELLIGRIDNPILASVLRPMAKGDLGLQTLRALFRLGWVLFIIAIVVFAGLYLWYRISHRGDVIQQYKIRNRQLNAEIADLEELIEMLETHFYLAGEMLGHLFVQTSKMQQRHSAVAHYLVNLKEWYRTTVESHEKMCAEARAPFVSLIRNDILDAYFKAKEESIIEENNVWRFIEEYEPSEDGIIHVQQDIKNDLLVKIKTHFEKFSIADYLINLRDKQSYQYLVHDFEDICALFSDLNRKSDIFLQYNIEDEGRDAHQVMFVHTDDEDQCSQLERELHHVVSDMDFVSISSPYKIIILQKHDLDKNQIEL